MAGSVVVEPASFGDLPDELLVKIFGQLGFATRRTILPLVCKQWLQFTKQSAELWAEVTVSPLEEQDAFEILQRSDQTGGLVLDTETVDLLSIQRQPVARWFQKRPEAAVSSLTVEPLNFWGGITMDLGDGALNVPLVALRGTLEHLVVGDSAWISSQPYFADLAWLTKLRTLSVQLYCRDGLHLSSADMDGVAALTTLESLQLSVCGELPVDPFPDAFFELPQLRDLSLWGNSAGSFADRLSRLTGLTSLAAKRLWGGVGLAAQQAATLSGLVTLDLSDNPGLAELPDLSALCSLRTLNCSSTGFDSLPVEQLLALTQVENLDFGNCREMDVPESAAELADMPYLCMLNIQDCKPSLEGMRAIAQFAVKLMEAEGPKLRVLVGPRDVVKYGYDASQGSDTVHIHV